MQTWCFTCSKATLDAERRGTADDSDRYLLIYPLVRSWLSDYV